MQSREAVIKALKCYRMTSDEKRERCRNKRCPYNNNDPQHGYWCCSNSLLYDAEKLLQEQPKRAKGQWLQETSFHEDMNVYVCSVCRCTWYLEAGGPEENNMRFCPECGSQMLEEEEVKQND